MAEGVLLVPQAESVEKFEVSRLMHKANEAELYHRGLLGAKALSERSRAYLANHYPKSYPQWAHLRCSSYFRSSLHAEQVIAIQDEDLHDVQPEPMEKNKAKEVNMPPSHSKGKTRKVGDFKPETALNAQAQVFQPNNNHQVEKKDEDKKSNDRAQLLPSNTFTKPVISSSYMNDLLELEQDGKIDWSSQKTISLGQDSRKEVIADHPVRADERQILNLSKLSDEHVNASTEKFLSDAQLMEEEAPSHEASHHSTDVSIESSKHGRNSQTSHEHPVGTEWFVNFALGSDNIDDLEILPEQRLVDTHYSRNMK